MIISRNCKGKPNSARAQKGGKMDTEREQQKKREERFLKKISSANRLLHGATMALLTMNAAGRQWDYANKPSAELENFFIYAARLKKIYYQEGGTK